METRKSKKVPQVKRECKCHLHSIVTENGMLAPTRIHTVSSRDFPKESLQILVSKGLMGKYSSFICNLCLERGGMMCGSVHETSESGDEGDEVETIEEIEMDVDDISEDNDSENQIINFIDHLIALLRVSPMTALIEEKLCHFLKFVGVYLIRPMLKNEYSKFSSTYKSVASLSTLDSKAFLRSCNQMLITFLLGSTGRDIDTMDRMMLYRFSVCMENIYHLKNSNLILPHCFVSNLNAVEPWYSIPRYQS